MIEHAPYGNDDPYKRLPTERYPRDPEAGQAVQVGFRTLPDVGEAWLTLEREGASERIPAQSLGRGLWQAQLPALEAGRFRYTLHARGPGGEEGTEAFDLPVGRWRVAARLAEVRPGPVGVQLVLLAEDGGEALLELSFPAPGVCRSAFAPAGVLDPAEGLPFGLERRNGQLLLRAEGIEVALDEATLELSAQRPGASSGLRTSLKLRWLELPCGGVSRFEARFETEGEALYGLGERFAGPDLRGQAWDVRVYEEYKEQGRRTYLPVPLLVSRNAWGVWLQADAPSYLDATETTLRWAVEAQGERARFVQHLIVAESPYGVTQAFTELTGEIALPPKWSFGPWMSANPWNSQAKAEAAVERTFEEDVPATVIVLEAWSDESTFYIFGDADYEPVPGSERLRLGDFRFGGRWPDPKGMIERFHERGLRVLLWQIPVHKKLEAPHAQHDADEDHMLEQGYMIRNADGSPYRNKGWWFTDALVLDATHPKACDWWFAKRQYLFDELGIDGMKTDGGEHLWGRDLRAHNGQRGLELVNRYAQAYVDAYHGFVERMTGGDGLTFSRSGYTGAQRSPGHWAGDENSTWQAFRSSITAGLTAGLAGISIWGWDIGGFSGEIPTPELYIRSVQMACFCPIMQYHSELHSASESRDRSPWTIAERHGDPRALSLYRAYAKLRMELLDYIAGEAAALAAAGQPLMRYPGLLWPERHDALMADPAVYLFGRDLLVCPVLEKGAQAREVRLPPGGWADFWSGATFAGDRTVLLPAPLERMPVLVRADSPRLARLLEVAATFRAV